MYINVNAAESIFSQSVLYCVAPKQIGDFFFNKINTLF